MGFLTLNSIENFKKVLTEYGTQTNMALTSFKLK